MLLKKNKLQEENKRTDVCQIKESYDKQTAKLKQREEDMHESLRKTEARSRII